MGFKTFATSILNKGIGYAKNAYDGYSNLDKKLGGSLTYGLKSGLLGGINHYLGGSDYGDETRDVYKAAGKWMRRVGRKSGNDSMLDWGRHMRVFNKKSRLHTVGKNTTTDNAPNSTPSKSSYTMLR